MTVASDMGDDTAVRDSSTGPAHASRRSATIYQVKHAGQSGRETVRRWAAGKYARLSKSDYMWIRCWVSDIGTRVLERQ